VLRRPLGTPRNCEALPLSRGSLKRFVKSIWQQILNRELEAFYIEKFSPIILVFELKKLILRKKNKKSS
jgi:hypothetical protein